MKKALTLEMIKWNLNTLSIAISQLKDDLKLIKERVEELKVCPQCEKRRKSSKEWRKKHPERYKEIWDKWKEKNKERLLKYHKEYYKGYYKKLKEKKHE